MRNSFWTKTASGNTAHVSGAKNAQPDALAAIHAVIDAAAERLINEPPPQAWAIAIKGEGGNWFRLFAAPSKDQALWQWSQINAPEEWRLIDPDGEVVVVLQEGDRE